MGFPCFTYSRGFDVNQEDGNQEDGNQEDGNQEDGKTSCGLRNTSRTRVRKWNETPKESTDERHRSTRGRQENGRHKDRKSARAQAEWRGMALRYDSRWTMKEQQATSYAHPQFWSKTSVIDGTDHESRAVVSRAGTSLPSPIWSKYYFDCHSFYVGHLELFPRRHMSIPLQGMKNDAGQGAVSSAMDLMSSEASSPALVRWRDAGSTSNRWKGRARPDMNCRRTRPQLGKRR